MWCEVWRWTEREKESQGQEEAGRNLPGAPPGNSLVWRSRARKGKESHQPTGTQQSSFGDAAGRVQPGVAGEATPRQCQTTPRQLHHPGEGRTPLPALPKAIHVATQSCGGLPEAPSPS